MSSNHNIARDILVQNNFQEHTLDSRFHLISILCSDASRAEMMK